MAIHGGKSRVRKAVIDGLTADETRLRMALAFVYPPLSLCVIGAVSVVMIVRIFTAKEA